MAGVQPGGPFDEKDLLYYWNDPDNRPGYSLRPMVKKFFYLFVLLVFGALTVGCSKSAKPTQNAVKSLLQVFPLVQGATWTYTDTEYDPRPGQPEQIIQAVYEVTDRVTEVKTQAGNTFARIQRSVSKLSADEGWSDDTHHPPQNASFWYILSQSQTYSANELPVDLNNITFEKFTLEYQFPMSDGIQWCPNAGYEKIGANFTGPTPTPCQFAGMRIVNKAGPQQTPAGSFDTCYQMSDQVNSGGLRQTFCNGIGVVERRYDHAGTRFGFSWVLTGFHK
jgi:hypothetical protein